MLVISAKKEACAVAEEIADKVNRVATPVTELVALKRVRYLASLYIFTKASC